MKKILSTILIIALVAISFTGLTGTALAAGEALNVSTSTTELLKGATVDFSATITAGDRDLMGYTIKCGGTVCYDSQGAKLLANSSANVNFSMQVTDAMLGSPITFVLGDSTAADIVSDNVTIAKKQPTIKLAASVKVSKKLAPEGGTIKFTFSIENQGDVRLEGITVSAPEMNSGKSLRDAFGLDPAQSYDVVYDYTLTKDVVINPVVNYTYDGVKQPAIALEPVTLTIEERHVVPTLTVDNQYPDANENVTFTLKVENTGNVPYTKMTVYMNGEEVDFPASKLNPGDSYSEDYETSFLVSTDVSFKVTLVDHTNQTVSVNSNTISIQLPVDSAALQEKLDFNMTVDRPALTSESTITFSGNITNSSEFLLSDISVDEATLGNVYTADELMAASSKKLEFSTDINETTTYNFVLTVKDRDGKEYTVAADPITVTVSSVAIEDDETEFDDAADVASPGQELTIDSNKVGSLGVLGIISIILIVLIIGVGIVLIVLWRKGASSAPARTSGPSKSRGSVKNAVTKNRTAKKPAKNYRDRNNF